MSMDHDSVDDVVVQATDVARTFGSGPNAVVAVHGVSFKVHAGELVALTGPSGSGKTTLLHLLAGLDIPTTGTVEWPAIGRRPQLRPGPIAIVFQAPSLMPSLDVIENVTLPLLLQGSDRRTARLTAFEALRRLDLESIAAKLPEELSGGQAPARRRRPGTGRRTSTDPGRRANRSTRPHQRSCRHRCPHRCRDPHRRSSHRQHP